MYRKIYTTSGLQLKRNYFSHNCTLQIHNIIKFENTSILIYRQILTCPENFISPNDIGEFSDTNGIYSTHPNGRQKVLFGKAKKIRFKLASKV